MVIRGKTSCMPSVGLPPTNWIEMLSPHGPFPATLKGFTCLTVYSCGGIGTTLPLCHE
ncbi:hypothetical protein AVEN_80149-1, partial [Araneus ventricosus]